MSPLRPFVVLLAAIPLLMGAAARVGVPSVHRLVLADAIGPATARFVVESIQRAERDSALAIVLELDTPGGLDASMREVVKAILGSAVPVIVWVGPAGARAASAGMFITIAAPIAAMAPGTSIGAAHPVNLGGGVDSLMGAKVTNDAAAYARSIADRHHRNVAWVERAVRESSSLSAEEAVEDSVVDLVAADFESLLEALDGRTVETLTRRITLHTRGAPVSTVEIGWRGRILAILSNPNFAYLLLMAGVLGVTLELYHPGAILPGVVGGISLLLAFYSMQSLPVRATGLLLLLLGLVMLLLEIKVTSFGLLAMGGVLSLLLGSLFLFEGGSGVRLSIAVVVTVVVCVAVFVLIALRKAVQAQRRPASTGTEGLIGQTAVAVTDLSPEGRVDVHGEYWQARCSTPVRRGAGVRVVRVDGLLLEVEPEAH